MLGIEWNKASCPKPGFDIIERYSLEKRVIKAGDKIFLGNMGNMPSHKIFNIRRIRAFKDRKTDKVEGLKSMKGIGRHAKRNNVVFLTIILELGEMIAFVTVED